MNLDIAAVRAALTPDRPAVHWRGRWHDYAEMNERANRLAARLHALGLGRFDRVAILAHNHLAHVDLWLAGAKAESVYAPLNPRLAEPELRAVVAMLRPRLLLHDAAHAAVAERLTLPRVSLDDYDAWLGDPEPAPAAAVGPDDPQMIMLTGGTISVQAESHPTEFRKIEILVFDE